MSGEFSCPQPGPPVPTTGAGSLTPSPVFSFARGPDFSFCRIMFNIVRDYDVASPMRDGVLLRGTVFRPDAPGRFPALVVRSPYGTTREGYERYVQAGYVVYAQDARGRYSSDGEHRLFNREDHGEDLDGYDTIEWAAAQPWCNGVVGQFGASYLGFNTWMSARARPPHLRAINAETIPPELSDIDFPGGSFRPARRIHAWINSIAPDWRRRLGLPPPHTPTEARQLWNEQTHAQWLGLLPWTDVAKYLPSPLAEVVTQWFEDPGRRLWWFEETVYPRVMLPNLDVTGWFDHCFSLAHVPGMQRLGGSEIARRQTKVIIGPWNHPSRGQRRLGAFDFGPAAAVDLDERRIQWFDHWLKGVPNDVESWPAIRYFEMGTNRWLSTDTWPPPSRPQAWHLAGQATAARGTLQPHPDGSRVTEERYPYNPHDPVPTLWTEDLNTMVSDRGRLNHRPDLLRFRSEVLPAPLAIAGEPEMELHAASSAPDTDFFVWLADESPDGTAMEISSGMVRARHRHGLHRSEPLQPGQPAKFNLRLRSTAHCFLPGHRIRVEIGSSDFPNYDRNHNTGGDDLREATLRHAEQTVLHGGDYSTRLTLPVTT